MKLFNRIRFKMVEGKRTKNYLLYAIGELVLVIIGILIALGINNWNQDKQLQNDNVNLQKKVLLQLQMDINSIKTFQADLDSLNQTYLKVLGRDYDKSKVDGGGFIGTILFEVNTLSLDRRLTNLVENAKLDDSEASEAIIEINSTYKLYLKNIDDIEQIIFKRVIDNLEEIERTQDWYTELMIDLVCRNDCINYLLKSEIHKSRIASLRFLYINGYRNIIDDFYKKLELAKNDLESTISN